MKEDFRKMIVLLIANFKRELDEQSIDRAEFFNTKTPMDKMDCIESALEKIVEKLLFSDNEFVSISIEDDAINEPPVVSSKKTTVLFATRKHCLQPLF